MVFNEKTKVKILKSISENVKPHPCPACGKVIGLSILDNEYDIVALKRNDTGLIDITDIQYIPSVVCICENCGYISMFSCLKLGADPINEK